MPGKSRDKRVEFMGGCQMLKIVSAGVACSFLLVTSATAQTGACAADIKKSCTSIEPGNLRIATCLKEHLTDLSEVCKARLAALAAARKTCRADVETQCGTVSRRIQKVACVKDALGKLGDDCKAAISAVVTNKR
jgi:hypothetical protein